ncbi:hypothetical protein [Streptomyces aidingensis]|uniref:Uncharacterized protein n=1 Tax=Streptomyces aidingensis TaxID=910347 RepID=A0A1I1LIT6_9ACTN|nr:hypothetical protein [Streptomyces aidingensis]SFC70243.1 hypothetical protein SAMN05421773_105135 [Streptomyces aidingensis]
MLPEPVGRIAADAAGGIVGAIGTDDWDGVREATADWFARFRPRDGERQRQLARLDTTADALSLAPDEELARDAWTARWAERLVYFLRDLAPPDRAEAVAALRALWPSAAGEDGGPGRG